MSIQELNADSDSSGMTPGRKIKVYLWMSFNLIVAVAMMTKMGTPDNIAVPAMYMITAGGLAVILGQSAVDLIRQLKAPDVIANAQPKPPTP